MKKIMNTCVKLVEKLEGLFTDFRKIHTGTQYKISGFKVYGQTNELNKGWWISPTLITLGSLTSFLIFMIMLWNPTRSTELSEMLNVYSIDEKFAFVLLVSLCYGVLFRFLLKTTIKAGVAVSFFIVVLIGFSIGGEYTSLLYSRTILTCIFLSIPYRLLKLLFVVNHINKTSGIFVGYFSGYSGYDGPIGYTKPSYVVKVSEPTDTCQENGEHNDVG